MSENILPCKGDVIMSPKFAYGRYENENKEIIAADGETTEHSISIYMDEEKRLAVAAETGVVPPEMSEVEVGAYDPSRATAKFVVEEANKQGGGATGYCPGDVYSAGLHVRARRLNEDGSYNPKGEIICFYMTGSFLNIIEPKELRVVGKMQLRFV